MDTKDTEGKADETRSGQAAGSPSVMITVPIDAWQRMERIERATVRLLKAVTARMSEGDDPSGSKVWEMFNAHRDCENAVGRSANKPELSDGSH